MQQIYDAPSTANRLFVATLGAFLFCTFLLALLSTLATSNGWVNLAQLGELAQTTSERQRLRAYLLLSNLIPFAGTGALALIFVFRSRWLAAGGWKVSPFQPALSYSTVFMICSLPFVGYLTYQNLQIQLPEWMQRSEDFTDTLLTSILTMESPSEFLLAFLTIAVTPAIGEELLMRGVIQRRIFQVWFKSHHLAIWLAAFLFSFVHFEFAGFAPRLMLGVLLGYAYHWSKSLWVPFLLHLLFNGLQVVIAYATGEFDPGAATTDIPAWWLALISLGLVIYLGLQAETRFGQPSATTPAGEGYAGADAGAAEG